MGFNPATFLKNTERIITGQGFKRVLQGIDLDVLKLATGGPLVVDSGNPMRKVLETYAVGVQLANNQTDLGSLTFQVPRDYDKSVDKLYVRFLAQSAGATNTPTIDATLFQKKEVTAISADLGPTISGATNTSTAKADYVEVKAEGLGLVPGAAVTFFFTTSAHATDALNIYALEVVYYSDLVYYEGGER